MLREKKAREHKKYFDPNKEETRPMRRTFTKIGLIALALVMTLSLFTGCQPAEDAKELVIFTWEGYVPDDIIAEFEEEYGVTVTYNYFTNPDEALQRLASVDGGEYDIVINSDYTLDIARNEGLMMELDKSKIPNYENLNPVYMSQFYDPENKYTVPYVPGTPLIIYDPSRVDVDITGYADLWDESLKDSIVLLDYDRVIVGLFLKMLGYSINETDPEALAQVEQKLLELKPNVRALNMDTPYETMLSGEATVGLMFGSQVAWVYNEHPDFKVVYPKEGMGFGIDCVFIPSNAPHADVAHEFLNFICDPEISARISMDENVMAINCNLKAEPYLSEEYLNNPALFIPDEVLGEKEFIQDIGAEYAEQYAEIWNRFKQA